MVGAPRMVDEPEQACGAAESSSQLLESVTVTARVVWLIEAPRPPYVQVSDAWAASDNFGRFRKMVRARLCPNHQQEHLQLLRT